MPVLEAAYCFFFQAEDGIRDVAVTGVQTCALPICPRAPASSRLAPMGGTLGRGSCRQRSAWTYIDEDDLYAALDDLCALKKRSSRLCTPATRAAGVHHRRVCFSTTSPAAIWKARRTNSGSSATTAMASAASCKSSSAC